MKVTTKHRKSTVTDGEAITDIISLVDHIWSARITHKNTRDIREQTERIFEANS